MDRFVSVTSVSSGSIDVENFHGFSAKKIPRIFNVATSEYFFPRKNSGKGRMMDYLTFGFLHWIPSHSDLPSIQKIIALERH